MRVSLLFFVFVTAFLGLAFGQEAVMEKQKGLWRRITAPVVGLYRRGKNALGGSRKSAESKARKSAKEVTGQKSKLEEGVDAVMDVLNELATEGEASVNAAKSTTSKAATSVKDTVAAGAEKLATAGASVEQAVESATETAPKEADVAVEGMADAGDQAADAAHGSKAAMAENIQSAAAGEEL